MSLQKRKILMPMIRHECGHLITARCLNFATGKIEYNGTIATAEIDLYKTFPSMAALQAYLERRIPVLYAGAIAESLQNGKIRPEYARFVLDSFQATASHDFAKIKELIRTLVGISFPDATLDEFARELRAAEERLSNLAAEIVQANVDRITDLALFFLDELERAARRGDNPNRFVLSKDQIETFLEGKAIKKPESRRSQQNE